MEKCSCYDVLQYFHSDCLGSVIPTKIASFCNGTKEREECSCGGDLAKCDFYPEKRKQTCTLYVHGASPVSEEFHWCKQTEPWGKCPSEGDRSKCTFDAADTVTVKAADIDTPNKNGVIIPMNTAEMWLAAQLDGGYYECTNGDIAYSKKLGLVCKDDHEVWPLENWDIKGHKALDELLGDCVWEKALQAITIAEAEKLLGRRILIP